VRVLVVEDERKVASFVARSLQEEGFAVDVAHEGREGLERALGTDYDAIVLDVMLPGLDGLGLVSQLRQEGRRTPVLLLTARDTVGRGDREIELTAKEYALLDYFMRNPGRVLTRPMIAEHVWNVDFDTFSNVIDVYVAYLRNKIDAPFDVKLLRTVRGMGYMLEPPRAGGSG
jgi:DNA-binding response OmpR family regulator